MSDATASTIAAPTSSGSGGGGLEIDADPRASGAHTSQLPHGASNDSPKCAATCSWRQTRVSANATTRSARDSATSSRALEQRLHALARIGRRRFERDPHESPLVEVAPEETRLLEHPDENARVALGNERGELVRLDEPLRVPERAVDRAKLRHRRHVGDREAPERRRVARAREQERLARLAVAPGASHHLHVALERVRVVDEADEPHVGLVDPHAEGGRRDDDLRPIGDEVVLDARPLGRLETGVVVLGAEAVAAQDARQLLGRAARSGVDDRGAATERAEALDEDGDSVLGVGDLLHVVAEVRAHDARVDDLELAAERLPDLAGGLGRGRRRHPEDRRVAERLEAAADEEVVGSEVVPPHAHAVHLVHDDEPDPDPREELDELRLPKAFGRRVDEPRVAGLHRREALRRSPPPRATSSRRSRSRRSAAGACPPGPSSGR